MSCVLLVHALGAERAGVLFLALDLGGDPLGTMSGHGTGAPCRVARGCPVDSFGSGRSWLCGVCTLFISWTVGRRPSIRHRRSVASYEYTFSLSVSLLIKALVSCLLCIVEVYMELPINILI